MFKKIVMCEETKQDSSYYAGKANRLEVIIVREYAAGLLGLIESSHSCFASLSCFVPLLMASIPVKEISINFKVQLFAFDSR
jgi:hypothetical protein